VIGHEVSHVVSQARGKSSGAGGRLLHSSMLEHRADAQGTRAASGLSVGGERIHVGAGNSANAPAQGIITKSDKMKIVNKAPFVREGVWKRGLDDMFVLRVKLVDEAEKAPTGSSPAPSRHKSKKTSARDRLDTAMDAIDPIGSGSTSVSSAIDAVRKGPLPLLILKGSEIPSALSAAAWASSPTLMIFSKIQAGRASSVFAATRSSFSPASITSWAT
jgi:hypothetical protein